MLRKLSIIASAISLFATLAQTEVSAQTRVNFKRGETSGKVTAKLKPNEHRKFVLSAYEGQEIRVKVYSKDDRVKVEGEGGPTENIFDAKDGDNVIRIYNDSNYLSSFTAVFTITSLVNNVPREISFKRGRSSAKIDSTIAGDGERKFLLRARAGQEIRVKILSRNDAVKVEGEGGLTENIFDAVEGDNIIRIYNVSSKRVDFMARFSITDLKNSVSKSKPTRISFAKGKSSKTIDLIMGTNEKSRKFVIGAKKGQTINVDIETKDAVERIAMNLDNAVDNEDDWLDGFGYLMVTTGRTGDYIIEVIKLDKKFLSAKMKVSIKADE